MAPALSVAHDAMFRPIHSGGAGDITLAYERRELMLAALAWRVLIGLSRVMRCFVRLPASEGDIKDGEHLFIGVMSGVASRSRRLMSCARSFIAATSSEIISFLCQRKQKG